MASRDLPSLLPSRVQAQPAASCLDDSFGPYAGINCRGGFDFTLLFEEAILSMPLSVLLILMVPLRIMYLAKKKKKVMRSRSLYIKLIIYGLLSYLQLTMVILNSRGSNLKTQASAATAALAFVGTPFLFALSYMEHDRTVHPSSLLTLYLSLAVLLNSVRLRTLWLSQNATQIAGVFTGIITLEFFALVLEVMSKRRILRPKYTPFSEEGTSGIISRNLFWWINPLFRRGYRQELALEDLPVLEKHFDSRYLQELIRANWSKSEKKGPNALLFVALSSLKWHLASAVVPRLVVIGLTFCQPFLLNRAIDYASEPSSPLTKSIGYGLIGAYAIVYVGVGLGTGQYQHFTYRLVTMLRGGLVTNIFAKLMDVSVTAPDKSTTITLMSADIERISSAFRYLHEFWANIIEVALAIWLLYRQLGPACAMPIAVAMVSIIASVMITAFVVQRQKMWLEAIQQRIAITSKMLDEMKSVKFSGLTNVLAESIHQHRIDELRISKKYRKLLIINMVFTYVTPVIAPILTFAVYILLARRHGDNTLDTAKVFTSLSLFFILTTPLGSLLVSIPTLMSAVGCFQRIQAFLSTENREETRIGFSGVSDEPPTPQVGELLFGKSADSITLGNLILPKTGDVAHHDAPYAFLVQNGSFGWEPEKEPIMRDVNIEIKQGTFTMIVGPVGCGKSTLLKYLLGETPSMGGALYTSSFEAAFCDQTPWLTNKTIRDSIIAEGIFDLEWYNTVVHACAIDEDLRQLPLGEETQIGSKGISLSGGQSQRIALARAVYSRKPVLLLDDIMSGLDADTENCVFHRLFGRNGLLRQPAFTVVAVSSSANRLPFADQVIVLGAKGDVSEQGTWEELSSHEDGYVSSCEISAPDWDFIDVPYPTKGTSEELTTCESAEVHAVEKLMDEKSSRQTGDIAVYKYYLGAIGWLPIATFVLAISSFVFCITFPNIWLKWWASANAVHPNQRLGYYLGIYTLLGVMALVCLVLSCWQMLISMIPKSGEYFHWALMKTVMRAPLSFFAATDSGVTLNRFSQDLQLIDMELPMAALNAVTAFVLCIGQIVLISVAARYFAAAVPFSLIIVYSIQRCYLRTSRQLRFLDLEAKSPLYSMFTDCISGLATIRAFGWQKQLKNHSSDLLDASQKPFYLMFTVQRWLTVVLDLFIAGIAVILITMVVTLRGKISGGYVGIALLNVILFNQCVKLFINFWTMMETHIGAVSRIRGFVAEVGPEDHTPPTQSAPEFWPSAGRITIKGVSAAYRADSDNVLRDISLDIRAGEKVGVCGRTGSGKTSFVYSILRMVELTEGSITIDGFDLSTMDREEVRSRIIGISQNSVMFNSSVRHNLDPGKTCSDDALISALDKVQLLDTIENKGGLDAVVDEGFLSHGQRQLFCLARALLRKSKIVILDEVSSSVDQKTDELIKRIINEEFAEHTVIAIAHKLGMILDFDTIVLLDSGRIEEIGSPKQLLSTDSAFRKLYATLKGS